MSSAFSVRSAALILCIIIAVAVVRAGKALMDVKGHIRWNRTDTYAINRMLPNDHDRDSGWDYVDRAAWGSLASLKMWGCLAALGALGLFVLAMISQG